ncbi:hypothetical protein [Petrocella sp. FN5]|uniref:hypothetical protein n=1 Tax=Petrocella sp. FN5 TaxID=3032002 RepID=UPI0023DAD4E0|nr:hypothetical protein [Petrocella sp. FN5]MDF1616584.1 hypothetical protein [Petrocella sp. FN5]
MKADNRIVSGIPFHYLKDYFNTVSTSCSENDYYGDHWHVKLMPLDDQVHGIIHLPRTEIYFEGDQNIIGIQMDAYRMTFLSAGG